MYDSTINSTATYFIYRVLLAATYVVCLLPVAERDLATNN